MIKNSHTLIYHNLHSCKTINVPQLYCCLSAGAELTSEDHEDSPDDTGVKKWITVNGDNNMINVGSSNQLNKPISGRSVIYSCTPMFHIKTPTTLDVRLRTMVFQTLKGFY